MSWRLCASAQEAEFLALSAQLRAQPQSLQGSLQLLLEVLVEGLLLSGIQICRTRQNFGIGLTLQLLPLLQVGGSAAPGLREALK